MTTDATRFAVAVVRSLRHGYFVGATGDRERLREMLALVSEKLVEDRERR